MFVRDFILVAQPFQSIAPHFLRDPRWLRPIVDEAVGEAARVSSALAGSPVPAGDLWGDVTIELGGDLAGEQIVRLDRGAVRTRARGLVVPIAWSHAVDLSWFPPISGDLEIAPIGLRRSELVLNATYQGPEHLDEIGPPPGARPGDATPVDSVVVHRVVETGVRAFLQHLALTLESEHPDGPTA